MQLGYIEKAERNANGGGDSGGNGLQSVINGHKMQCRPKRDSRNCADTGK